MVILYLIDDAHFLLLLIIHPTLSFVIKIKNVNILYFPLFNVYIKEFISNSRLFGLLNKRDFHSGRRAKTIEDTFSRRNVKWFGKNMV